MLFRNDVPRHDDHAVLHFLPLAVKTCVCGYVVKRAVMNRHRDIASEIGRCP